MRSIETSTPNNRPGCANGALRPKLLVLCALCIGGQPLIVQGQVRLPDTAVAPALPEPIYWKQDLFLVPYQWSSAAEAGAAQAVWLYVSKDRGATWQKISEARPHVKSFNYRAESDGEYWFAVRTIDKLGRTWPSGPYQPELRVIVDTTLPQISELSARQLDDGSIEIAGRASDANLDPTTLKIEAQLDASGTWQPVSTQPAWNSPQADFTGRGSPLHAIWQPPSGSRPLAIRATVLDSAGNPATYQAQITTAPAGNMASTQPSTIFPAPTTVPNTQMSPPGWISSSAAAEAQSSEAPVSQPWPAVVTYRAPFRLFSSGPSLPDDGITAYGNPPEISGPQATNNEFNHDDQRVAARYAGTVVPGSPVVSGSADPSIVRGSPDPAQSNNAETVETPLQPFGQASVNRLSVAEATESKLADAPPSDAYAAPHAPPMPPKLVGSRTFALEYDLDDIGRWGVTNVELWGTRDGGLTWHSYARDDDQRSPLVATVDEEGLYGFRIVVETAGVVAQPPVSGERPELWVAVDLRRPAIELTEIERGQGNLADHLILRWRAADDNLEPRPISLFYSSRPAGPWSAVATNLEDTGEYAWRVERHVPARFYLRAEARDTAGNLAAFQTREPTEFTALDPSGRLRDAESVGPTATGLDPSYR